jgi:hypothetical protein
MTHSGIRSMLCRLVNNKRCVHAIGIVAIKGAAFDECPPLLEETRLGKESILKERTVMHANSIKSGYSHVGAQEILLN